MARGRGSGRAPGKRDSTRGRRGSGSARTSRGSGPGGASKSRGSTDTSKGAGSPRRSSGPSSVLTPNGGGTPRDNRHKAPRAPASLLDAVAAVVVAACAVATYVHATGYYFSQDDFVFLARAKGLESYPDLLGPLGTRVISTRLYFQLMHDIFGMEAGPYHWASVLLHALNAALVYIVARLWTGERLPAIVAGLTFATFDLAFTAVYWVSGVQDLLALTFLLISALIWVSREEKKPAVVGASAAAMAMSLLCKEVGVLFPGVLFLMAWARGGWRARIVKALGPHFVISAGALVSILIQSSKVAEGGAYETGITTGLFHNLATYVFWATDVLSPFKDRVAAIDYGAWKPALVIAAAVLTYLVISRGKQARMQWAALGWCALMIAPVLPLLRHTYLYYLYPAAPGVAMLLGLAARRFTGFLNHRYPAWGDRAGWAVTLSATAGLCLLGVHNVRARETTYLREDIKLPHDHVLRSAVIAGNAAATLAEQPVPEGADLLLINPLQAIAFDATEGRAKEQLMTGSRIEPKALRYGLVLKLLRPDLGSIVFADRMEAKWEDRDTIFYDPLGRLSYIGAGSEALANLALLHMRMRNPDLEEAMRLGRRAISLSPSNPTANLAYGIALFRTGSDSLGREYIQEAVSLTPSSARKAMALEWLRKLEREAPAGGDEPPTPWLPP